MVALPLVPVQDQVLVSLRAFLLSVLPAGVEVIVGQVNRVAEPAGSDFVVMTPTMRRRLETNVDLYADCAFVASVSGSTLSVTQMLHGTVVVGRQLSGLGVPAGTTVAGTITGTGGTGTYALSGAIGTIGSETMACGALFAMQPTEITVQCDFHGPSSADNVQIASTLFRDDFAIQQFGAVAPPVGWQLLAPGDTLSEIYVGIAPLYADDPRQSPFIDAESQYEDRWTLDACLQANQIVTAPQQFAATVRISPTSIDATFPP